MKTGSVIQRVALLIMVVALGVAMMACEAAAGKPGEPGKAGEPGAAGEPGGVPPQLETALGDVSLTDSGATATAAVNLGDHFWDPDDAEADLDYEASSDKTEVVTVSVAGSTLTLTAVAAGTARVTVTATDADDLSTRGRFNVTVVEAGAPTVTTIPAQMMYQADGAVTINLADHFSHANTITYDVASSPVGIVALSESNGVLTIIPLVVGQTRVTVTGAADGKKTASTFLVDVMAGSEPVPVDPPDPPIGAVGTIAAQTVEVGKSVTINVADNFSKADGVTYTASSDDTVKATAEVDTTGMLTIAGVEAGSANVTVSAAEADGASASHMFAVEVIDPLAPYSPATLTIEGIGKSADVRIDAGQSLRSLNTDVVRVKGSGTAWMIEAVKKGMATVRILNANQSIDSTIMVTVENTAPMVIEDHPNVRRDTATGTDARRFNAEGTALVATDTEGRSYHKVVVPFTQYFKDADDDDIETYEVTSLEPFVEVVEVVSHGADEDTGIVIDIIKNVKFSFHLEIAAVDKDGAKSGVVLLSVTSTEPHSDNYQVAQDLETGRFETAMIYKRIDVEHELRFKDYKPAPGSSGFNFIEGFQSDLLEDEQRYFSPTEHLTAVGIPDTGQPDPAEDVDYFVVTSTDPVKLTDGFGLSFETDTVHGDNTPQLAFKLESDTPGGTTTATVTITYYVSTCADNPETPLADCLTGDAADWEWDSVSKTLTMNIVPSSEAYEE